MDNIVIFMVSMIVCAVWVRESIQGGFGLAKVETMEIFKPTKSIIKVTNKYK